MSEILTKAIVLVLNRNWQAINVRTPTGRLQTLGSGAPARADFALANTNRKIGFYGVALVTQPSGADQDGVSLER